MKGLALTLMLLSIAKLLSGCGALKAAPAPDSGFLGELGQYASANQDFPFHRVWAAPELSSALGGNVHISVAAVDVSRLQASTEYKRNSPNGERALKEEAEARALAEFTRRKFTEHLAPYSAVQTVAYRPSRRELTLELSLVELKPTDVARTVVGTTLGAFVPGGGLVSVGAQGTVAIEGKLSDPHTGKVVFAFADRESGKLAPINLNDYRPYSHARAVVDEWSRQWSEIVSSRGTRAVADSLPITLLPA